MAKLIEARVIQKVDTEANWMANPLKLYQGEVAFVSDKYNFKLNTTSTPKTFAQLEYYYNGDIIGGVSPTDDLASKPDGVYRATISGTYSGVVVKEGYYTLLRKDNGVWKLESEVEMPTLSTTGVVEEGNTEAVSGGEVYDYVKEYAKKEDILSLINVDSKYPLNAGNYTLQTALNAIPQNDRILGQRITFNVGFGIFKTYKFTGASLTNTYYLSPKYWEEIENESLFAFGDSVTEGEKNYLSAFKGVALKGDWKGKALYIRGVAQLDDADGLRLKRITISYDTSGVHTQIAGINIAYDAVAYGIKRYDFTFGSYSGYIIVDTATIDRGNITAGSIPASKAELVNIIDLNEYSKEIDNKVANIDNRLTKSSNNYINVSIEYPLPSGEYYTLDTAIAAIPQNRRLISQRITFKTSTTTSKLFRFNGGSTSDFWFLDTSRWIELENDSLFYLSENLNPTQKNVLQSIKKIGLKGDWKNKRIFLRASNKTSETEVYRRRLAFSSGDLASDRLFSFTIDINTDTYGVVRKDFNDNGYSGFIVVDTAQLNSANIPAGSILLEDAELLDIIDLNDYAREIPKASETSFGIVKIGDGLKIGEDGKLQTTSQAPGSSVSQKPYPSKLNFELMDDDGKTIAHLSKDGKVIYATRITRVMQSTDEGVTWDNVIYSPNGINVNAVRELEDGEILFSTRNSGEVRGKIYKTIGYKRDDLSNVTAKEVLECMGVNGHIFNSWGLDVYENIVVASEYGLQGETGARYAYLSTDYGDTFNMIFDQKNTTENIVGAAPYTSRAHVHTIHYDRYMDRIWIVCGDQNSAGAYYSDDLGVTWGVCANSVGITAMQFTGINSYPEGVFFGTDRHPDGVWFWERGSKEDIPEIKPYYLIPREEYRTFVFGRAFRRYAEKDEITFFNGLADAAVEDTMGGVVVAYKGTKGIATLITLPDDIPDVWSVECVGVTHGGYIVVSGTNRANGNKEIYRAKAPVWE